MSAENRLSADAREREIFLAALEKDPAEREAFLDEACRADKALRQRLQALFQGQEEVGSFMETPVMSAGVALGISGTEQPGDCIGRYKLLQKIGEGGAGVVYMAEQEEPVRRRVALKVIKLGMDTKSVIARFEAERQALAMMDHPNIAKVLDAGATESGRPFFVMELVRGVRITEYCDHNHLSTRERLGLFIQVCQAIQHAHQKGIIHRDIKPSNILVTLHDGKPVPKVIDFGIAKATEQRLTAKTLFTEFSTFIGTPAYMSPEQAEMSGLDIDTRSDIYSLGVLLYELLIGRTPFDAETLMEAGLDECRRTIREQEPARPSTRLSTLMQAELTTTAELRRVDAPKLIHLLRGDLDWIAMMCLEKDRTRRYATTNDLAVDVQRYLNGEPILARPPSSLYRFQKFVRRNRGAFSAAAAVAVTLIAGAALSGWQAVRAYQAETRAVLAQEQESQLREQAEREQARAEQGEALSRLNEYVADINLAQQSLTAGNYGRALQLLDKHRPTAGGPDLRGFEWRYLWQLCKGDEHLVLPVQDGAVQSVAFSPNGELVVVGVREKFNVVNVKTKAVVATLPKNVISMVFLPDGQTLITASDTTVRMWNTADWSEIKSLPENGGPIALSTDGKRLATASREGVRVWDTEEWKQLRLFRWTRGPLAFSPDGQLLATESMNGLTLWSIETGKAVKVMENSTNLFSFAGPWFRSDRLFCFSPDGKKLVAARNTLSERGVFVVSIWDTESGKEIGVMPDAPEHVEHTGIISSLAFSQDGNTLATASMDYSVRLWDFSKRKRIRTLQGHLNEVWTLAFSPDGQRLVSGAKDGTVKVWPLNRPPTQDDLSGAWEPIAFSKDSRTLAVSGRQGMVAFFNMNTRELEQQFPCETVSSRSFFRPPPAISLSSDLGTLVQTRGDGTVRFWNTGTRETNTIKISDRPVDYLVLSPDGHTLVTGGRGRGLQWWDVQAGEFSVMDSGSHRGFFSPDGRSLVALQMGQTNIEIWETATRAVRATIRSEAQPDSAVFSPDGHALAVICFDDAVHLWDTVTAKPLGLFKGHKQGVFAVAFSPDGKTLATTSDDNTLKLWNVATQQELLTIRRLGGALRSIAFSPDGQTLAVGSSLWSATPGVHFYRAPMLSQLDETTGATNLITNPRTSKRNEWRPGPPRRGR